jgi:3-hydroxyisobutyrate dehydrogenase-like beta-hydroxyacid dehydrogenase
MRIGIIGLGNMGQALGTALAKGGRKVVGWNRTPRDFSALSAAGMPIHPHLEAAAAEADVLLLVSLSYASTEAMMQPLAGRLAGKILVQLCSGLPDEAAAFAAWAKGEGARSLDVAVMGFPSDIGSDRILFVHSGDEALHRELLPLLAPIGPRHRHVGTAPGLAKTYDNVLLARNYAWMMSYLQAAALARAAGLDTTVYTEVAMSLLGPLYGNIDRAAKEIATGRFAPAREASISVHHKAVAGILEVARRSGAAVPILAEVHGLMASAIAHGAGDREIAACFPEFLRPRSEP